MKGCCIIMQTIPDNRYYENSDFNEIFIAAMNRGQDKNNAMIYKGSVLTVDDLPTNASIGDVYNVMTAGMNYVWVKDEGEEPRWDALGGENVMGYNELNGNN